jgi:hypothetical protein
MQLELEAATHELEASRAAHAELASRHAGVSAHYGELQRQCREVRGGGRRAAGTCSRLLCAPQQGAARLGSAMPSGRLRTAAPLPQPPLPQVRGAFRRVDGGLRLDARLCSELEQQVPGAGAPLSAEGAPPPGGDEEDTAEDMLPLAERLGGCVELMHGQWRTALERASASDAAARRAARQEESEHTVGTARRRAELGARGHQRPRNLAFTRLEGSPALCAPTPPPPPPSPPLTQLRVSFEEEAVALRASMACLSQQLTELQVRAWRGPRGVRHPATFVMLPCPRQSGSCCGQLLRLWDGPLSPPADPAAAPTPSPFAPSPRTPRCASGSRRRWPRPTPAASTARPPSASATAPRGAWSLWSGARPGCKRRSAA